ncbi:MAG: type 1 periplasmic binding fold superfamily protein [Saprospiraceae bacterium]|nr:type 1 periplasmic binding fold superfamily protein [Saprospiraceae bacterium]
MKFYYILILGLLVFTSCNDDDVMIENPEELITTVRLSLNNGNGTVSIFTFRDLDGDGGNEPTIAAPKLTANTTYTGNITFVNETEDPQENITEEIEEEDLEHQIFYSINGADASLSYLDTDPEGNPVGLSIEFVTGEASSGTLVVTLKHEPVKDAAGVAEGDITNAGGETDIEVTFPLVIE